jgi:uncharacterized membrane protein
MSLDKSFFDRVHPFPLLVIFLLILGIFFRIAYLDRKVYWVDEVATSIRVAGYTRTEVMAEISDKILHPSDLLVYRRLTPDRDFSDTLRALSQSPEHAPLYFIGVRGWAMIFGSSAAAMRSLSVLFSLVALPCLYALTLELWQSHLAASIAVSLAAVSPFFVAYAQEARPYSLWQVWILLSSLLLLRAVRLHQRSSWLLYSLSLVVGFYTSLLSIWVAIGQGIWVLWSIYPVRFDQPSHPRSRVFLRNPTSDAATKNFAIATLAAVLAFAPWLWVISQHWQRLQDNTTWMRLPMDFLPRVAIGLYNVVIGFVDFPVYVPIDGVIIGAIVVDFCLLAIVGFSFYFLMRRSVHSAYLFVVTLAIATPFCLIVIDLLTQGQSSTAPRYLIPVQIAIELAIAHLLSHKLGEVRWRFIFAVLISMGVISCAVNLETSPKYQKIRNLHNGAIAHLINADISKRAPLVIAESSETMDMLSLSRNLDEDVVIEILSDRANIPALCQDIFVFNPSREWREMIASQREIQALYQPKLLIPGEISLSLWTLKNNCSTRRMSP